MGQPHAPLFATVRGLIKSARSREYAPFVFLTTLVGVKLADAPLEGAAAMGQPHAPLFATVRGLIKLARSREYAPFVFLTTLVGVKLANAPLHWRLPVVLAANFLTVCYAFMVNDIEDAHLDALHPAKRRRNPVSSGELSPVVGAHGRGQCGDPDRGPRRAAGGLGAAARAGRAGAGLGLLRANGCGSRPIADLVSHTLMLAGIQFLVGYVTYTRGAWSVWQVLAAFMLFSAYGELYNELHDLETDAAGGPPHDRGAAWSGGDADLDVFVHQR